MIIQCDECQARFRLADEKIKPTGTKVRCSKCKHVFTVMPPPEEPAEEPSAPAEQEATTAFSAGATPSGQADPSDLDRAAQQSVAADEQADNDPFAREADDTSEQERPSDEDEAAGDSLTAGFEFSTSPAVDEQQSGPIDFEFSDDAARASETADEEPSYGEFDFGEPQAGGPAEFDFGEQAEGPAEFDFDDEGSAGFETAATAGDFPTAETPAASADDTDRNSFSFEEDGGGDFGFDTEEHDADWSIDSDNSAPALDFEEPRFETETQGDVAAKDEESPFGEINFGDDEQPAGLSIDDPFAPTPPPLETTSSADEQVVGIALQTAGRESEARPTEEIPVLRPQKPAKKGAGRSIALLFLLLLLVVAGGIGYLYLQGGGLRVDQLAQSFPFLQPYLGQPSAVEEAHKIEINIKDPVYVTNREAGQLLVVHGHAINNYATSRSSITIKGVLLDKQERILMQQTVFCGNPLDENDLSTLPFARIEEAMNNEFGDSLSNMNVAAKAKIPFTVVFRNLPDGIANINIEVVDSKPGSR